MLKHRLGGGVPNLLTTEWSPVSHFEQENRKGIMHYMYSTIDVDMMYDSKVMNTNVSKFGIFLDFSVEKVQYFHYKSRYGTSENIHL